MLTDAYVVKQVQAALTAAEANDGKVMYAVESDPAISGKLQSWAYRNEGVNQSPGTQGPLVTGYRVSASTVTYTSVDHSSRTWSMETAHLASGPYAVPPATYPVLDQDMLGSLCGGAAKTTAVTTLSWPDYLRAALGCGAFQYAGYSTVNGERTIVLDSVPSRFAAGWSEKFWVDPETYLPIREERQHPLSASRQLGYSPPGTFAPITTDFQWLPPTPENVAKVTVSIPAGFREVR